MAYPKRTKRPPVVVDGVVFLSWQTGIGGYELKSEDERAIVYANAMRPTYCAIADRRVLSRRFLTEEGALRAAARALLAKPTTPARAG